MRDDDDDDDDSRDERDEDERPPRFPGIVMAAGVIWIGVGSLALISTIANIGLKGANQQAGAAAAGETTGVCCSGLIGIAFVVCGYQTVTGKSSDTLGNGIGSLVLGLLQSLAGLFIAVGGGMIGAGNNAALAGVAILIGAIVGLFGSSLILAGILALAGRSAYREWRLAYAPRPRRRRRRRREDEDEDED